MAKKIFITGDTHGAVAPRVDLLITTHPDLNPEDMALIILGDAGINYYLSKTDLKKKRELERKGVYIYCVYGNHEERPGEHLGMRYINDEVVGGAVWIEENFPHIRYFTVWGEYNIQGLSTLVLGGAYSVDKHYRLQMGYQWFENEQLKDHERNACLRSMWSRRFDLILSHTCPYEWIPTDLFLSCVDQSTVDNTMEKWLSEMNESLDWRVWLFAHYHTDRVELPHVEIFYHEIESLEDIFARWERYDKSGELDWWIPTGPNFQKLIEKN